MTQHTLVAAKTFGGKIPFFDDAADLFKPHLPCDEHQLRQVYLRLALRYHPDKRPAEERTQATQLFQAIAAAYEALLVPAEGEQKKEVRRVRTAVAAAAELGDLEELKRLLLLMPESAASEEDETGARPLMFAAAGGSIEAAQLLLDFGADINAKNFLNWPALLFASLADQKDMVAWLVNQGADLSDRELILTAWTGNAQALSAMLDLYQDSLHGLFAYMNVNKTLLHMACEGLFLLKRPAEQHAKRIRMLLQRDIPVNLADPKTGRTCLHDYVSDSRWACRWQKSSTHMEILEELCLAGANVSCEDIEGNSAMSIASAGGCDKVRAVLYAYA